MFLHSKNQQFKIIKLKNKKKKKDSYVAIFDGGHIFYFLSLRLLTLIYILTKIFYSGYNKFTFSNS